MSYLDNRVLEYFLCQLRIVVLILRQNLGIKPATKPYISLLQWHSRLARRTYKSVLAKKCEGREFEPPLEHRVFYKIKCSRYVILITEYSSIFCVSSASWYYFCDKILV